jgi:hypothetical protein
MIYQYKPTKNDPQADRLPYGCRLVVIPGTREGYPQSTVQVKDSTGEPQGRVFWASLEVLR